MRNSHVKDKNSLRSNRVYQACKETCIEHVIKKIVTIPPLMSKDSRLAVRWITVGDRR